MSLVSTETIRLICLDFDGTCVTYENGSVYLDADVVRLLNQVGEKGVAWCSNSGRTLESQQEILAASRQRGLLVLPEALLCGESFLYIRNGEDYQDHTPWNRRAVEVLTAFHLGLQERLHGPLHDLAARYDAEKLVFENSATAYLLPTAEAAIVNACLEELNQLLDDAPHAYASRNGGWVFVGHREFGKGRVLDAYLRERGLSDLEVVAVGDNLNDLDMLDGTVCRHVGCPGDSIAEVKDVVQQAGGLVGREAGPAGTLEVLRHFLGPA